MEVKNIIKLQYPISLAIETLFPNRNLNSKLHVHSKGRKLSKKYTEELRQLKNQQNP